MAGAMAVGRGVSTAAGTTTAGDDDADEPPLPGCAPRLPAVKLAVKPPVGTYLMVIGSQRPRRSVENLRF